MVGSLGRLFEAGTSVGLGEGQLLDQFLARGDEAALAILQRHGRMVLEGVTDADLRRVAAEVFAPSRHAGAVAAAGRSGR